MQKIRETQRCADVILAVMLAAFAGACSGTSGSTSSTPSPEAGGLSTFVSDVASDVRDATDSMFRELGLASAGDGEAAKPAPVTPPVPQRAPRRNRAAAAAPPEPDPEPADPSPSPVEVEAPAAIEPAAEPVVVELPPAVDPSIVYSETDANVEPPRLRTGVLPRWVPPGSSDVAAVEVVVSQEGGVERVKLASKARRLIDVMALSAAKMWRFDPALKDGEPVRYRLVVESTGTSYR